MKKWLLLALSSLIATPAFAATYYIRGGVGNDNAAGTSYAAAWNTVGKANTAARPGDVIYIYPRSSGSYVHIPNPDSAGSNPTGNGKITFIGASNLADPLTNTTARNQIAVPGGVITRGYTVIKGIRFNGDLSLAETADRDSIVSCTVGGVPYLLGCDYTVLSQCIFNGARADFGYGAATGNHCVSDTVEYCTFPFLGAGVSGGNSVVQFGKSVLVKCDSIFYVANRHTIVMSANSGDTHPRYMFNTRYGNFYRNYWRITVNNPNLYQYSIRMRDSTYRNVIRRDTVITDGPGRTSFQLSSSGSSAYNGQKTVFENVVDSCYWNAGAAGNSYASYIDGAFNCIMSYTTLVMRSADAALRINYARGKNVLRNNTIVNFDGYAANFKGDGGNAFGGTDSALVVRANIFASYQTPVLGVALPPDVSVENGGGDGAVVYDTADIDSGLATTQYKAQSRVVSNHNLYAYYGTVVAPGDRSLLGYRGGAGSWKRGAPGDSSATAYSHLENTYRMDSLSVYGSPQFDIGGPDSTATISFNAGIGPRSAARGIGLGGQDAGAIAYVGVPAIRIEPTYISFPVGIYYSSTFEIINDGTATLTVSSITASGSGGITVSPASASVAAGATQRVTVTYSSGTTGSLITILSNDPNNPTVTLPAAVIAGLGDTIEE